MSGFCNIYYCIKEREESPQFYVQELLEYGFRESFGIPYKKEEILREKSGKPVFPKEGICFNVSHGHRIVAIACSCLTVGIDVESPRRVQKNTMNRCCTEKERVWLANSQNREMDFLKLWTLKESYVKMTGKGLRIPPDSVGFSFSREGNICCDRGGYFRQYELHEGVLSVCIGDVDEGTDWSEMIKIQKMSF